MIISSWNVEVEHILLVIIIDDKGIIWIAFVVGAIEEYLVYHQLVVLVMIHW